ncbi:MAG: tetratricopeptide repeat protein [Anaerolineae bacterium]|nr:tetratricopeptide repeat protein [Anaerolineae bacterium]
MASIGSPPEQLFIWQSLQSWLEQDEEGRALLARLRTDPQGAAPGLARWLQAHRDQAPPHLTTLISGGQVEHLVNIAQAGIVQMLLAAPPAPPPALHSLPPDISDFVGRRTYLEEILGLLTAEGPPAVVILAIAGMPGVGKSALAIHAAHHLRDRFPDAQLYADLRAAEGRPLNPSDVLAGFLRALGVDDQHIPKDLAGRSALYRSSLDGKRALILLDNACDEAQVRPLLPGSPTCAVLITSRRPLAALEGAHLQRLDVMSESEALELLERLVGTPRVQAEPDAARRIVALCGRLPLALRIAGGTLRGKPHWPLAEYAGALADERKRLERLKLGDLEVRASFALSYRDLSPEDARLFRLLGLVAGPDFAPGLAAAFLDATPEAAWEGIERLVDAQLVEPAGEGRYRLHDLPRLFARERLEKEEPPEAQEAACRRAARHLNELAGVWNACLTPSEARRTVAQEVAKERGREVEEVEKAIMLDALAFFDRERENLLAAVEWAFGVGEWSLVVSLAGNLVPFFNLRALWADWEATCKRALEAARRGGDQHGEATTLMNLGSVYSRQGRWEEALEQYEQALETFRALGDRHGEAQTLTNLGSVYLQQGRWEEALEQYEQALEIFRALGDRHGEGQTLMNLGILHKRLGQEEKARALWREALGKLHPDSPEYRRVREWLGEG